MAVSERLARSSTSSNGSRLEVSSPSESTTIAWRRTSSALLATILLQILQRDVDRVVQRRRAAGRGLANRLLELGRGVGEGLEDDDAAVEADDFGEILRPETPGEADGGFLRDRQPGFHAGAGVEQERERDWQVRPAEQRDVLLDPVLEDAEILGLQVGHIARRAVRDGDVQRHDVDAGAERGRLLAGRRLDRLAAPGAFNAVNASPAAAAMAAMSVYAKP